MKFAVEGRRLNVLTKTVRFMARYTETVSIVINTTGFVFKAINDTRSGYVEVRLQKDFFCYSTLPDDDSLAFGCKVDVKSLQMVFRVLNLDKMCEKCTIIIDEDNYKIKVEMKIKNSVHREFIIPFMENEVLKCPLICNKMNKPTLKSSAKFLSEVFSNFVQSTKEATIWLFDNNIRFKNFIEKDAPNYYEVANTNFTYLASDFSAYNFVRPFSVTFNVKDVKSFVEFGCHQNQLINTYFLNDKSPFELNFKCTSDNYTGRLIIATFEFNSSTQPQPPPFNPSQRSTTQSQQTCTTLNYTMSSSTMSPHNNPRPATAQNHSPPAAAQNNSPPAAAQDNSPPAATRHDSVSFSMNTPNSTSHGISENINEIIENLPDFSNPQDENSEPIDYLIDFEGSQLKEYHKNFFFGRDSQDLADLETIISESEEEI